MILLCNLLLLYKKKFLKIALKVKCINTRKDDFLERVVLQNDINFQIYKLKKSQLQKLYPSKHLAWQERNRSLCKKLKYINL